MPPTNVCTCMRCGLPSILITSPTWRASSRVGARTTIRGLRPRTGCSWRCSSASRCTSGSENASVLPVPVRERPSMSWPARSMSYDC